MKIAFKVDVDTCAGACVGVANLCKLFSENSIEASLFFALGEDEMGKSLKRIFQKGFLKKCLKSNVVGNYSLISLLQGVLLPAPVISEKCADAIKRVAMSGFECGIHSWSHYKWQNYLQKMSAEEIQADFAKAKTVLNLLADKQCDCCASAGWQISEAYLEAQQKFGMRYASDTRGKYPFLPRVNGKVFSVMQIPTTLATLDEFLCENKIETATDYYLQQMKSVDVSVMTIHAELEGMAYLQWFSQFLQKLKDCDVEFVSLKNYAQNLSDNVKLPVCDLKMLPFENRGGLIATQII